jgi:5-carboxyvanillate decarboxylase
MRLIDLEAHFFTQEYLQHLAERTSPPRDIISGSKRETRFSDRIYQSRPQALQDKLVNFEGPRLEEMNQAGIDMQVVGLTVPGVQMFEASEASLWARKTNDHLAKIIQKYPHKFIGLASVAPQNPQEAAQELERAVTVLGLGGLVLLSHVNNEYLDNRKYWPIFEMAAKLDVPINLHPSIPSSEILKPYAEYGYSLAGPILGFAADAALHAMRLIFSGLFDTYPNLKIILGHMGEALPFWLTRIDFLYLRPSPERIPLKRKPSDYFKSNFIVNTSGVFFQPALLCTYLALGADKIAFAVDYPFEDSLTAARFISEAPISNEDKEKICHGTAERIFKLI